MNHSPRFYFANLGADVTRCIGALEAGDEVRYQESLARTTRTLNFLRDANRPEAYEEGILLITALREAQTTKTLGRFREHLQALMLPFATL